jgi:hypothetical protein
MKRQVGKDGFGHDLSPRETSLHLVYGLVK